MEEITEKEVQEIKRELDEIKSVVMLKWPFFASLLRKCRIILDPNIPTAGVNILNEMRINPQFLMKLNDKSKVFVYNHEVMHIALCHLTREREGEKNHELWNNAGDSVINHLLFAHGFEDVQFPFELVTPKAVASWVKKKEEEIAKMGVEGQYYLLEKHCKTSPFNAMMDLFRRKGGGGGSKKEDKNSKSGSGQDEKNKSGGKPENKEEKGKQTGGGPEKNPEKDKGGSGDNKKDKKGTSKSDDKNKGDGKKKGGKGNKAGEPKDDDQPKNEKVVQEGDPEAYDPKKTPEETEEYWKKALAKAIVQARQAGKLPADAERIINDLLKAKVNWKMIIKKVILDGLGKSRISTWRRPSRKHPLLPGIKQFAKPNVWFLPDTSASTTLMLPQFFGEMYSILKYLGKGVIISWDAQAYPPIELKKDVELVRAVKEKKIRGGGGTVIAPVLKVVLESMKAGDVVVVITDGEIFDLNEKETQILLQQVAKKSNQPIFASVNINVPLPLKWKKVKIEV